MAPLTQIQKAVYANQTMAMERESVLRAARVVAKARKELLAKVQAAPKTTSIQQATLSSLDAVLKTLPQDIMRALRTDELVEKGYRQGRSLLLEVAKGTDAEGKLSGFAGILDLRTYSQDANQAVAQIKGLSEQAKSQIKAAAEVSLALGEGEVDTMRRLFGDIEKPGEKTPFRSLKISAERIARTVTNSLVNSGKSSAYQQYADQFPELGILNEWVNVTDFRTSDTCRALVGQKRPPGQAFQGGGFSGFHPPAHPNCRSTIIPTIGELVEPVPAPTLEPDIAQSSITTAIPPILLPELTAAQKSYVKEPTEKDKDWMSKVFNDGDIRVSKNRIGFSEKFHQGKLKNAMDFGLGRGEAQALAAYVNGDAYYQFNQILRGKQSVGKLKDGTTALLTTTPERTYYQPVDYANNPDKYTQKQRDGFIDPVRKATAMSRHLTKALS
jgi:hypothetical protein